ncbi:MAG: acetate--CoA ligase family protein [Promethearchaeota archaeon]
MDLSGFFNPRSIAIVGASDRLSSWGFIVLHNIVSNNFQGKIFPINPRVKEILGLPAYSTILEIPPEENLDLVIIIIKAPSVKSILEQCTQRGVKNVVVISGGFRESGKEGTKLEEDLITYAKENGIRIIGPNGMGIVTTRVGLTAVMWPVQGLKPGGFTLISQSGNIGTIGLSVAARRGIGLSAYISGGNFADLQIEDYLEYLGNQDSQTKVIGLYLEGVRDGRRFAALVREISKTKPVIILKAGGTETGRKAALSHTGAITGDDQVFKQILKAAGAIIVDSLEEMFDLVLAFKNWHEYQFLHNKVVILTRGGGWGVMTSDACSHYGVQLAHLPKEAYERIDALLPSYWSRGNPIDTVADLNLSTLREIIQIVFEEMSNIDAMFLLGVGGISFLAQQAKQSPYILNDNQEMLDRVSVAESSLLTKITKLSLQYEKPVFITTLLTPENSPAVAQLSSQDYPVFRSPHGMVKCFRHLVDHYKWRQKNN